jgi:hypothetical protein
MSKVWLKLDKNSLLWVVNKYFRYVAVTELCDRRRRQKHFDVTRIRNRALWRVATRRQLKSSELHRAPRQFFGAALPAGLMGCIARCDQRFEVKGEEPMQR